MSYDYEQFITRVEQVAEIGWEEAERATRATLETLAERIAAGEAVPHREFVDVTDELPNEYDALLARSG